MDKLILRKADLRDSKFLFDLRNEESVRRVSLNDKPITSEEHRRWFEKKIADPNALLLIAEIGSEPIAQVRFDARGEEAEVSVAVVKDWRGKGYGTEILRQSARLCFKNFPAVERIRAFINLGNDSSVRSFSKAGYQYRERSEEGGLTRNLLILERER